MARRCFKIIATIVPGALAFLCCLGLASCGRSQKESGGTPANDAAETGATAPVKKPDGPPPLSAPVLDKIARMAVLVQIPGQPDHQGILLEGAKGSSSARNYQVVCDAPAELESVCVAYRAPSGLERKFAKKISVLSSGLSIYGFTSKSLLACSTLSEPVAGETFHAIALKGGEPIPAAEQTALAAELETIRTQLAEAQKKRSEAMSQYSAENRMPTPPQPSRPYDGPRPMPGGRPMGVDPRAQIEASRQREQKMRQAMEEFNTETAALSARQASISPRVKFPITSITASEIASAVQPDALESAGARQLENTLLATSSEAIRAIRFRGKWLELKEVLAPSANRVEQVKLSLSGSQRSVRVSCDLESLLPLAGTSYSMVAETTFGLESQGVGSLEERLAQRLQFAHAPHVALAPPGRDAATRRRPT